MLAKTRTLLVDVIDPDEYAAAVASGYIKVRTHPSLPYHIHNYTEACVWEQAWGEATMACRGLVTHADTGEIIARPFGKFFNHNQPGAPEIGLDDDVVVTDKADGSLAILVPLPGDAGHLIATRGSFTSDQAIWATDFYARTYADRFTPNPGWTYLFEAVYPDNRVVLDYGELEALILIGAVDIATGRSVHVMEAAEGWPGQTVEVLPHATLREALQATPRANAEGLVVWHPQSDTRVKIKQEDYLRLHRIVFGLTTLSVWEALAAEQDPEAAFAGIPDEWHSWLKHTAADLRAQHTQVCDEAAQAYQHVIADLPDRWNRKDFALVAARHPMRSMLFLLLDGKDISGPAWRAIRPRSAERMRPLDPAAD